MKTAIAILCLSACGYSAKGNELVGQVKKVTDKTPILCGDYTEADISLGVLRNGVGSMSKEDMTLYVDNDGLVPTLKAAAESGAIVKVTYDTKRLTFCVPEHWLVSVAIEK